MLVNINKRSYQVNENEFKPVEYTEYCNLTILGELGVMERISSLLGELRFKNIDTFVMYNPTHGGYIPITIANKYPFVCLLNVAEEHKRNIVVNAYSHNVQNIKWELDDKMSGCVVYSEKSEDIDITFIRKYHPIIVTPVSISILKMGIYKTIMDLTNSNLTIYVSRDCNLKFFESFKYYIKTIEYTEVLDYDNLINLCIMVKNGGEQFEQMLQENMHLIDRWTILDTGSTDKTVEIIEKTLVGKKKGSLYMDSFLNFRDSRNRLLELAGESCKFTLMLDDTYVVKGDLRKFLNEVRGDQFSDSFSLYVKSDDVEYGSNRILKSDRHLKYKYKIHEVIQAENNNNVIIPFQCSHIFDGRFDYMEERTNARKQFDLRLLHEEINEDPDNPRTYYYMAQTYNGLQDWENAYKYFMLRANHPVEGFIQEKIDAIFEGARCAKYKLNKPWAECEALYKRAYELDKTRPDSIYFLGIHYYLEGDKKTAYEYFKLGFEIGYPLHCQYSLKPTLSYHFLPKFLTQLCYEYNNYPLGEKCSLLYLTNNSQASDQYTVIASWYNIFVKLNKMEDELVVKIDSGDSPLLCFVADGGFEPWTGTDILTKGVGGSETYIIEMARYIQKRGDYKVIVFCNCLEHSVFEGVEYIHISQFMPFAKSKYIHTCIISRFSEYVPVAINGKVENLYMVLHDLTPSGIVIPISKKMKNIFCLSEWHVDYFTNVFPQFKDITVPFYYGIDVSRFNNERIVKTNNENLTNTNVQIYTVESSLKVPYKFIYSSYPNRGLYELLLMWPSIVEKYPKANLHIYSDVNGKWVNDVAPELMQKIRDLYVTYEKVVGGLNIYKYGWVNKETLAEAWKTSEYWLYPCTFMETFCLTAVEAALSKTLAITNGLAALQNTVGNRGVCIEGDARTTQWREKALVELFSIMENSERREQLIEKNYKWAKNMSWENQANKLLNEYINKNKIYNNELDKYYWTQNIPIETITKVKFDKAIKYYLDKNVNEDYHCVLEIGVNNGTSLIEIISKMPNSIGIGIDSWLNTKAENNTTISNTEHNDVEELFYKNVKKAGLEDRIKAMKGISSEVLLELVMECMQYDFIYINERSECLDIYIDLFLSWQLLRKNGVMAINNNVFNAGKIKIHPYGDQYEPVNKFLKYYEGKYSLIDKDNVVFLEKII